MSKPKNLPYSKENMVELTWVRAAKPKTFSIKLIKYNHMYIENFENCSVGHKSFTYMPYNAIYQN